MEFVALIFGVNLIDLNRPSSGILVASGCGIMMALADECEAIRYVVDMDQYRGKPIAWRDFGRALKKNLPECPIIVAGWFSLDIPDSAIEFSEGSNADVCYSGGNGIFKNEIGDFGAIRETLNRLPQASPRAGKFPL